ncbi:unnamed protein product [Taenia asiatica]|uniref:Uncharacterized protein n=1 Tax=Taenia asiatica TaxID=60517 RepID=A0A3P6Q6L5_TAEAS|nr:unnamed protein product [Taenia asiatica]
MDHSNLLPLNFEKYNEFLLRAPRNYSVVLMLTALSHRLAADEFAILSRSYLLSKKDKHEIFFATADYDEDSEIFTSLNQNTVPVFIHFPPTTSPKKDDVYDITRNGLSAEVLAQWVFVRTGVHSNSLIALRFRIFILIFYMISGQVWNSIRRPPAFHSSAEEGLVRSDAKLIIVILTDVAQTPDSNKRRGLLWFFFYLNCRLFLLAMAVVGTAMFAIFTSLCLSLFRKKNQSYPYRYDIQIM